ncbi:unnamed protein product, partial [Prorocentrum cordatum]
ERQQPVRRRVRGRHLDHVRGQDQERRLRDAHVPADAGEPQQRRCIHGGHGRDPGGSAREARLHRQDDAGGRPDDPGGVRPGGRHGGVGPGPGRQGARGEAAG